MPRQSKSTNKPNRIRQAVAQEAAKIMATEGITDFKRAKEKAANRLNTIDHKNLPTNQEIDECLREYQSLFLSSSQPQALVKLRETAVEAMKFFDEFKPELCGSVLSGTADSHSTVDLHIFSDDIESVVFKLNDNDIPFEQRDIKLKVGAEQWEMFPLFLFMADDVRIGLVVFAPKMRSRPPLSKIDGKPIERANRNAVETLLKLG